jgi:hypothetical protein
MTRLEEGPIHPEAEPVPQELPALSARDVAQYAERMCAELTVLSERTGLGFLAYLLEVAREEARLHCDPAPQTPTLHGELPPR